MHVYVILEHGFLFSFLMFRLFVTKKWWPDQNSRLIGSVVLCKNAYDVSDNEKTECSRYPNKPLVHIKKRTRQDSNLHLEQEGIDCTAYLHRGAKTRSNNLSLNKMCSSVHDGRIPNFATPTQCRGQDLNLHRKVSCSMRLRFHLSLTP